MTYLTYLHRYLVNRLTVKSCVTYFSFHILNHSYSYFYLKSTSHEIDRGSNRGPPDECEETPVQKFESQNQIPDVKFVTFISFTNVFGAWKDKK